MHSTSEIRCIVLLFLHSLPLPHFCFSSTHPSSALPCSPSTTASTTTPLHLSTSSLHLTSMIDQPQGRFEDDVGESITEPMALELAIDATLFLRERFPLASVNIVVTDKFLTRRFIFEASKVQRWGMMVAASGLRQSRWGGHDDGHDGGTEGAKRVAMMVEWRGTASGEHREEGDGVI